jgi:Bacterial SH3 domain
MAQAPIVDEEQFAEHRSTTWAHSAEGDECWSMNSYRNEHRWLHDRVRELERQLRRRTIVLAGALALSGLLLSFTVVSSYEFGRPTVVPAVAPSSGNPVSSPAVMSKGEKPSQIERSQAWAMGEEQIELIAALHFDAQRTKAHTDQLTTTWREAGGSETMNPETSARGEVHGGGGAVARGWSPVSHETVVSVWFNQDGSRAARASERSHYTAKDFVNLRAAPNNSAEVLTVVAQGALVRRTGHDLGWLQVEYSDHSTSSISGWVYGSYLRSVESSGQQPRP